MAEGVVLNCEGDEPHHAHAAADELPATPTSPPPPDPPAPAPPATAPPPPPTHTHDAAECRAYNAPPNATLGQWLAAYPSSWMTRELVGRTALYRGGGHLPLTHADLRLAQQRLHYFAAVLLLERPESSMRLLQAAFGWREVGWSKHRAGSRLSGGNSTAAAELAAAGVLQEVQRRHALDLELYEYAEALHAKQLHSWGLAASADIQT